MIEAEATALLDAVGQPLLLLDAKLRVVFANQAFEAAFNATREAITGRTFGDLENGAWRDERLERLLLDVVRRGRQVEGHPFHGKLAGGSGCAVAIDARPAAPSGIPSAVVTFAPARPAGGGGEAADSGAFNHRVRNHFASYASMMGLERLTSKDEERRRLLTRLTRRLYTYSCLYRAAVLGQEPGTLDLSAYLGELAKALGGTVESPAAWPPVRVTAQPLQVDIDSAVKIGTVVNELAGSVLDAGGGAEDGPQVDIRLGRTASGASLRLASAAAPASGAPSKLSDDIVAMYIDSLGARIRRKTSRGKSVVEIALPAALVR